MAFFVEQHEPEGVVALPGEVPVVERVPVADAVERRVRPHREREAALHQPRLPADEPFLLEFLEYPVETGVPVGHIH
jgi:hypothetical protein